MAFVAASECSLCMSSCLCLHKIKPAAVSELSFYWLKWLKCASKILTIRVKSLLATMNNVYNLNSEDARIGYVAFAAVAIICIPWFEFRGHGCKKISGWKFVAVVNSGMESLMSFSVNIYGVAIGQMQGLKLNCSISSTADSKILANVIYRAPYCKKSQPA